jgi:HSP20 family molecular chaperone IbpA
VKAAFTNGVLEVHAQKVQTAKPKKVKIAGS